MNIFLSSSECYLLHRPGFYCEKVLLEPNMLKVTSVNETLSFTYPKKVNETLYNVSSRHVMTHELFVQIFSHDVSAILKLHVCVVTYIDAMEVQVLTYKKRSKVYVYCN